MSRPAFILPLFISVLMACSCNKEEAEGPSTEDARTFNQKMESLSPFTQPEEIAEPVVQETSDAVQDPADPSLECYTTTYKVAPGFDEMLALDPTTDVIYPGAMLLGASIPTGEYIPIIADRAPITLSISLQNLSGSPVVEIENPKLSTVRSGIKSILDQEVASATPAKLNFEISEVYSEQHLKVALGANYRSAGNSVSAAFNFSQSTYSNKFLIKYLQTYYTIDMDPPADPADLFTSLPEASAFGSASPAYVASMAYGRMVLYTVETNRSFTEVNAAFSAAFASGDGSIDTDYQQTIAACNIKAVVIGGSAASAARIVNGPAEVYNYIAEGGNYSKESPGAPLSYKLRYLKKGTPVATVVLASEYQVRTCDLAYPKYRIRITSLKCNDCPEVGDPEIYGRITGRAYVNGSATGAKAEWKRSRDDAWEIHEGQEYGLSISADPELYRPDYNTDYIKVDGWLKERDAGDDDDLGADSHIINLKDIKLNVPYPGMLTFSGNVDVKYTLERVR
ncbi:MAG: thiol-activated cytolysin family protein [Phaeodactylibacter sp.]|nr:thiol-activated cytolysin family protein [Phaeodactylibacter sp.]